MPNRRTQKTIRTCHPHPSSQSPQSSSLSSQSSVLAFTVARKILKFPTTSMTMAKTITMPCLSHGRFLSSLMIVSLCVQLAMSSPTTHLQQQQQQQQQQRQFKATQSQLEQQQQLSLPSSQSAVRVQQCREGCYEKFSTKESLCRHNPECLTCWDECAKPPPPKINKLIRETWSLHTVSMLQQDSLVLVDVAWEPLSTPNQCLVTWEVSGGGLMGNLLTESFNVQLSLWPDTKYRVQVTCKNKLSGSMSRSLPLTIDTAEAITPQEHTEPQQQNHVQPQSAATPTSRQSAQSFSHANDINSSGNNNKHNLNSLAGESEATSEELNAIAIDDNDSSDTDVGNDANLPVLPYDEQSAETLNQHTNFIFNWHNRNSDISAIEPLHKPDLNILSLAALSDMQKPLLFGVVAGTLLLTFILLLYVCAMRQQRSPADKAALIEDDVHSVIVSMPSPAVMVAAAAAAAAAAANSSTAASTSMQASPSCKNATHCARNALRV